MIIPDSFKGKAKKLEDIDLPRIAATIGCGEDEVHMLIDVETLGSGFDSLGRPKMLFEPHKFYSKLTGANLEKAVKLGLAYSKWGTKKYPKESYTRLSEAMRIDASAALKSCSWGAGQIMGEHYRMLGYATVEDMVAAFCEDEDDHIEAMIAFVKASHIDDELRVLARKVGPTSPEDCAVIARVYNGPGYRVNEYHIKMAAAHNKWRKIRDTPYNIDDPASLPALPKPAPVALPPAPVALPSVALPPAPVALPSVALPPASVALPSVAVALPSAAPLDLPSTLPKFSFWKWLFS